MSATVSGATFTYTEVAFTKPTISVVLPVLAPTPFLRAMTEFCIKTLRAHADAPFELVVVEAEHNHFDLRKEWTTPADIGDGGPKEYDEHWVAEPLMRIDKYLNFTPKIGGVREINAGIDAASGNFIVTAGNDVIVPPHWDTELLRAFNECKDCGVSALSAAEPGAYIGPQPDQPLPLLVEGMYSPFMMFRKGWRFEECYERGYQDSDLIMRMYTADPPLRAYRNCRASVHHLLRMTNERVATAEHDTVFARDEKLFYERWGACPLHMFMLIRSGQISYGREHEALLRPINLRHDPPTGAPV